MIGADWQRITAHSAFSNGLFMYFFCHIEDDNDDDADDDDNDEQLNSIFMGFSWKLV